MIESVAATDSVFIFMGVYGAVETIAGFAYEAVVDLDAHDVSPLIISFSWTMIFSISV